MFYSNFVCAQVVDGGHFECVESVVDNFRVLVAATRHNEVDNDVQLSNNVVELIRLAIEGTYLLLDHISQLGLVCFS